MSSFGRASTSTRFAWGPSAKDWRGLFDIGVAALEKGWIDPAALTTAIVEFRSGAHITPRDVWVQTGLLTSEQANELHRPLDASFNDALYGGTANDGSRYVVERALNEGGMGRVLVCLDRALGRRVAIKTLRHDNQTPPHVRALAREARVTGNLEHPGIIPVYDVGVSDDDGPFYAMRLVEQYSLEHVLIGLRQREPMIIATWTMSRLLRTFVQVCQAVHYAHSRNVVHCDLKPSNILLGSFGEVLVGDWGMAYDRDKGAAVHGGTPAYMAPEQLGSDAELDARTDVFALGAILYRILTLRTPFAGPAISEILRQREAAQVPPRPSTIAPADRPVPQELEEIAMKAMELDPAKRFTTADDVAAAIDTFLEGTREREQKQRRAAGLAAQGEELAARYHEMYEERQKLASELLALTLGIDPWASLDERRRVWDAEDELAVVDALLVRTLQEAVSSYEHALVEQPKLPAARSGLARLYADLAERAREQRANLDRIYFEGQVRHYDDDGILLRAGGRPGWLNIELTGSVDEIALAPLEERDRVLVTGTERRLRRSALEAVPAAPGSYVLRLTIKGKRVQVPVLVRGDRETHVVLDLASAGMPLDDEIFVPGGPVALGAELAGTRLVRDHDVATFFVQTFPVTFGRYLEFLEHVHRESPGDLGALMPYAREDAPLWEASGRALVATAAHADLGLTGETWTTTPVVGVDASAANAFARWWSARTGKTYRLPTESEWEKAARGVDGRRYPWGDRFEPIFCKMMHSRSGAPRLEPVGAFTSDVSPYGVRDMAGGVADWCVTDDGFASRGGAWSDAETDCAVTARRRMRADERSTRVGFRLVR